MRCIDRMPTRDLDVIASAMLLRNNVLNVIRQWLYHTRQPAILAAVIGASANNITHFCVH